MASAQEGEDLQLLHGFFLYTFPYIKEKTDDGKTVTTAFMWDNQGPMKQILHQYMDVVDVDYYHAWIALGTGYYHDYGAWLTSRYFGKYVRHFILPNSPSVVFPRDIEVLGGYEAMKEEDLVVRYWFDAPVKPVQKARKQWLYRTFPKCFPWIELGTWIIFIAAALFLLFGRKRREPLSRETSTVLWHGDFFISLSNEATSDREGS